MDGEAVDAVVVAVEDVWGTRVVEARCEREEAEFVPGAVGRGTDCEAIGLVDAPGVDDAVAVGVEVGGGAGVGLADHGDPVDIIMASLKGSEVPECGCSFVREILHESVEVGRVCMIGQDNGRRLGDETSATRDMRGGKDSHPGVDSLADFHEVRSVDILIWSAQRAYYYG